MKVYIVEYDEGSWGTTKYIVGANSDVEACRYAQEYNIGKFLDGKIDVPRLSNFTAERIKYLTSTKNGIISKL